MSLLNTLLILNGILLHQSVDLMSLTLGSILQKSISNSSIICVFFLCCCYCGYRQRLPPKNVYYYRCPDHRRNYVMSFAFCFDREDDVYQFAYCYPYTYSRLQHYLASLERRNLPYLQREQLGLSVVSQECIMEMETCMCMCMHTCTIMG